MAVSTFDFEKPIVELEAELEKLREVETPTREQQERIVEFERKLELTKNEVYANLTAWQRIQIARHQARPHALYYIQKIFTDWTELHGDRHFSDDHACVTGFAMFGEQSVAVIGQQKGSNLHENIFRNYGSMHPEGYRKALRIMKLADKFGRPIMIFIDTAGAFPGIGAEERGQAEAIARNIMEMATLRVPIVCVIIGEGGSGGALGVGLGNRILILENAYYSVISPEGCASILWRDAKFAPKAAESLRLSAKHLKDMDLVDEILPEPVGGAHRDPVSAAHTVGEALGRHLDELLKLSPDELLEQRFRKFRAMGVYGEEKV